MQEATKPETALVKKGPKANLKEILESRGFMSEISKLMPKGSPEAFQRALFSACLINPVLYRVDPDSLLRCCFDLAQMGLYPDGRRAHLIPFWDSQKQDHVCQLIVDYKGIAELARRNGDVASIHCDVVHEGEDYRCEYGTHGGLRHVPDSDKEDRPVICAYSYVQFAIPGRKELVEEYIQMSFKAIEKIRAKSKSGDKGPWKTDWEEMAKKTVFRRHAKTLVLSPETRNAVEYGEDDELGRFRNAVPAIIPKKGEFTDVDAETDETGKTEPEKTKSTAKPVRPARPAKGPDNVNVAPSEKEQKVESEGDFFQTARGDDVGADFAQQLDTMIKASGIERAKYFEWLNFLGVRHARDEKLKVMAAVDLKTGDLEDCVENWGANLEHFKNWSAK